MPLWKGRRNKPIRARREEIGVTIHYQQGWKLTYGACKSLEEIIEKSRETTVRAKGGRNRTSTVRSRGINPAFLIRFKRSADAACKNTRSGDETNPSGFTRMSTKKA